MRFITNLEFITKSRNLESSRADGVVREREAPDARDLVVVQVDPHRPLGDVVRHLGQGGVCSVEPVVRGELISPSGGRTQN